MTTFLILDIYHQNISWHALLGIGFRSLLPTFNSVYARLHILYSQLSFSAFDFLIYESSIDYFKNCHILSLFNQCTPIRHG